eukprot:1158764-Pelagomonas_calceolata.AAC.2
MSTAELHGLVNSCFPKSERKELWDAGNAGDAGVLSGIRAEGQCWLWLCHLLWWRMLGGRCCRVSGADVLLQRVVLLLTGCVHRSRAPPPSEVFFDSSRCPQMKQPHMMTTGSSHNDNSLTS